MHELERIAGEVDATHARVGPLVAAGVMCVVARRMLLVVAPAGCGKSIAGHLINKTHPYPKYLDSVTRAGLKDYAEELENFPGVLITDDLGKTGSHYHRMELMLGFAELVYTGMLQRGSHNTQYSIAGFHGSAILNCQPSVLRSVISKSEWDATIADKTIRYYHIYRPIDPNELELDIKINWNVSIANVVEPNIELDPFRELVQLGLVQWGRARARQHVRAMLKACAAIDGRAEITPDDARVLRELMRPMVIERVVMSKSQWEQGRDFNVGLLCLLIEFATYGSVTLEEVMIDYKLDEFHARGLMAALNRYWTAEKSAGLTYHATPEMQAILDKVMPRLERIEDAGQGLVTGIGNESPPNKGAKKGNRKNGLNGRGKKGK